VGDPGEVPVGVVRLPRGPDGGRGFDPATPRARALLGGVPAEQGARAALRSRFLRALGAARGRPARFWLWGGATVDGVFGAAGGGVAVLQVDALRTPLGVQTAALLRGSDVLAFAFPL
ncbi:GEMI7 protein, partial [Alopecoenas beccarii]|nr:GEMI7 protein [Alopecoenas beccarii]